MMLWIVYTRTHAFYFIYLIDYFFLLSIGSLMMINHMGFGVLFARGLLKVENPLFGNLVTSTSSNHR